MRCIHVVSLIAMGKGETRMLDLKLIRTNPEQVRAGLVKRGAVGLIDEVLRCDQNAVKKLTNVETLKNKKKCGLKVIGGESRKGRSH